MLCNRGNRKGVTFAARRRKGGREARGEGAKLVLFVLPIVRILLSPPGCNIVGEFMERGSKEGGVNVSQSFEEIAAG